MVGSASSWPKYSSTWLRTVYFQNFQKTSTEYYHRLERVSVFLFCCIMTCRVQFYKMFILTFINRVWQIYWVSRANKTGSRQQNNCICIAKKWRLFFPPEQRRDSSQVLYLADDFTVSLHPWSVFEVPGAFCMTKLSQSFISTQFGPSLSVRVCGCGCFIPRLCCTCDITKLVQ